jgi:hypothetical protein
VEIVFSLNLYTVSEELFLSLSFGATTVTYHLGDLIALEDFL